MDTNRRWIGWIAVGLGALALLVALAGGGFGSRAAAVVAGGGAAQSYEQQGQQAGPGTSMQPGQQQRGRGQQGGPGMGMQPGQAQRGGEMSGGGQQQGPGRQGGFGLGGLLHLPLRLLGGVSQMAMLALLIVLGLWLIRGRNGGRALAAAPAAGPAPAQPSPTGEYYTEEPRDQAE